MNYYLDHFSVRDQFLDDEVSPNLGIVVVIPCYNEPDLVSTLQSLNRCDLPVCQVEVITVINSSEIENEEVIRQNKKTLNSAVEWKENNKKEGINFYFIFEGKLPGKDAGVGLARKIGMDEAVRRFEKINKKEGVIVCFDADSLCQTNYLAEIEKHFNNSPNTPGCSIHFEHPLSGDQYGEDIYVGIAEYELHLRYYKNALDYCGLPYAYHTIGSSMAVRNSVYQKQNGMNKRKAGEDFYFLQKIIPLGNFTELTTTTVIPSPRISDRVPFGTGKAMQNYVDSQMQEHLSYNLKSFIDLKQFCKLVPNLYTNNECKIPGSIQSYLNEINWKNNLEKIRKNSPSKTHFVKQFYNWFNAFKVLKFVHYARDHFYNDVSVYQSAKGLLELIGIESGNKEELIYIYRKLDKKHK